MKVNVSFVTNFQVYVIIQDNLVIHSPFQTIMVNDN
jgi:hypothetical protein